MNFKTFSLLVFSVFLSTNALKAQDVEDNIRMVKPFKADGISNEWNEPLNQYNDATKLAFAIANDDNNLYIVVESLDPQTTFSVLRGGITLNINTQGKKKDGVKLTFPLMERPPAPEIDQENKMQIHANEKDALAHDPTRMNKSIRVSGFKGIPDGELATTNQNGIETGMSIHPNRDLIYELSIPLSQLQVGLDLKKPIVYNIRINQPNKTDFKRPGRPQNAGKPGGGERRGGMGGGGMSGGGRGGSRGGMGGGSHRPAENAESASKSSDFWIKYKLVKA